MLFKRANNFIKDAKYPDIRLRRNRRYPWLRELVAETTLTPSDLIWPVFVREGEGEVEPVNSMPDVFRYSIDKAVPAIRNAKDLGIPAVAIFPVIDPKYKSEEGREALNHNNLISRAVRSIKNAVPDIGIICDVALDPYTTHGHDGLLVNGKVDNDKTLEILCKQALVLAGAGADIIAPSDMMDGRIGAIRSALDSNNFKETGILSYAVKYASNFYGPFREALGSASALCGSDKKTYQMDIRNINEAIREAEQDVKEGADMIMVKPGLPYLDVIKVLRDNFSLPLFAYQVSGEYAMIMAAGERGWLDADSVMLESLISIKRAGASAIFTYAALDISKRFNNV